MSIFHCSFDLDYVIHRGGAAKMAGNVRLGGGDKPPATFAEVLAHAVVLKARGFESLPTCSHHDRLGNCRGHPSPESP